MPISVYGDLTNLRLLDVGSANGAVSGTLTAATANTVTWKHPGASAAGSAVTLAAGQVALIYGSTTTYWVRVQRTSTSDMSGSALVTGDGVRGIYEELLALEAASQKAEVAIATGFADARVQRPALETLHARRRELMRLDARRLVGMFHQADLRGNF